MRVSGSTPPLPPAVRHTLSSGRPDPLPGASEPDAPAEGDKVHGLVRAAEHSHRSDVAALRQWINHPDLRGDLSLPDLSAEHKGNGFQKAVAAYQAIIGIADPPPATDPPPVVPEAAPGEQS